MMTKIIAQSPALTPTVHFPCCPWLLRGHLRAAACRDSQLPRRSLEGTLAWRLLCQISSLILDVLVLILTTHVSLGKSPNLVNFRCLHLLNGDNDTSTNCPPVPGT